MVETPDGQVFLTVQAPPVRILVTGRCTSARRSRQWRGCWATTSSWSTRGPPLLRRSAFPTWNFMRCGRTSAAAPRRRLIHRFRGADAPSQDRRSRAAHALRSDCFLYRRARSGRRTPAGWSGSSPSDSMTPSVHDQQPAGPPIGAIGPAGDRALNHGETTAALEAGARAIQGQQGPRHAGDGASETEQGPYPDLGTGPSEPSGRPAPIRCAWPRRREERHPLAKPR